MDAIRITDLDVSPDMTKVVVVGINHRLLSQHPPSSTGAYPAPGAPGDSTSQSPPSQPHELGHPVKTEDRMVVRDMATKQTTESVSQSYVWTIASDSNWLAGRWSWMERRRVSVSHTIQDMR